LQHGGEAVFALRCGLLRLMPGQLTPAGVFPVDVSRPAHGRDDGCNATGHITARRLRRLYVHVQRPVLALPIDEVHQVDEQTGFAGLARGVQDEIFVGVYQARQFGPVHPVFGQQGVVDIGFVGACGVEEFVHGAMVR
jgi:hypothetical protein